MLKGLLCSVAMIGLLAATPALAETGALADCTDANMMFANADVAKVDGARAIGEIDPCWLFDSDLWHSVNCD